MSRCKDIGHMLHYDAVEKALVYLDGLEDRWKGVGHPKGSKNNHMGV